MRTSPFRLAAIAGSRPLAGLEFVGAASASSNTDATPALSLTSLTGGIGSSAIAGDLVIGVIAYVNSSGADVNLEASGDGTWSDYTEQADLFSDDSLESYLGVFLKVMGATPDTSIEFRTVGTNGARGTAIAALVYRRASSTVSIQTATGIDTNRANPPTITPSTAGSLVLAIGTGAAAAARINVPYFSGSYTNRVGIIGVGGTYNAKLVVQEIAWTSGAVDPPAWTDSDLDSTGASWCAATLVVAPV
jgi:hypothetical protein